MILPAILSLIVISLMLLGFWAVANLASAVAKNFTRAEACLHGDHLQRSRVWRPWRLQQKHQVPVAALGVAIP